MIIIHYERSSLLIIKSEKEVVQSSDQIVHLIKQKIVFFRIKVEKIIKKSREKNGSCFVCSE